MFVINLLSVGPQKIDFSECGDFLFLLCEFVNYVLLWSEIVQKSRTYFNTLKDKALARKLQPI